MSGKRGAVGVNQSINHQFRQWLELPGTRQQQRLSLTRGHYLLPCRTFARCRQQLPLLLAEVEDSLLLLASSKKEAHEECVC